ncbi:MAG: hypothetical protein U0821_24975 [Chloroflexota bacterium]
MASLEGCALRRARWSTRRSIGNSSGPMGPTFLGWCRRLGPLGALLVWAVSMMAALADIDIGVCYALLGLVVGVSLLFLLCYVVPERAVVR